MNGNATKADAPSVFDVVHVKGRGAVCVVQGLSEQPSIGQLLMVGGRSWRIGGVEIVMTNPPMFDSSRAGLLILPRDDGAWPTVGEAISIADAEASSS
jgi:hypothetical protein